MLASWLPWKFILKHIARSYGFLDPVTFMARLRRFSQPSEVQEPLELIRAGLVFHARGLINTKVIQNNLDWIWPYWVEKQFNPRDPSFLPRAYSLTHVNLTQRNWTAVGTPDLPVYPIVDPRGLVTPLHDGWSIDFWVLTDQGEILLPSRLPDAQQEMEMENGLAVNTRCCKNDMELKSRIWVTPNGSRELRIELSAKASSRGWLAASVRPYNPEGIQFIEKVGFDARADTWEVDNRASIRMSHTPDRVLFSNYQEGDVIHKLAEPQSETTGSCSVGMVTAAALFPLAEHAQKTLGFRIPLHQDVSREYRRQGRARSDWQSVMPKTAALQIPDSRIRFLYEGAKKTLLLLSAVGPLPGPYTYRRFWFRDACFMINALLSLGLTDRCARLLDAFPSWQKHSGYFQSQEGEWDSNGQVLWIINRFQQLTDRALDKTWMKAVTKGAGWIQQKRTPRDHPRHGGLLPAGFSAEHLGPNDFYYWDDFWGLAGLQSAARLAGMFHSDDMRKAFLDEAADFEACIFGAIQKNNRPGIHGAIPASPYRRMDSGAVGSLAADYPLQITSEKDERITKTADFLMDHCLLDGGFFQDMIHSGINIYLTLSLAQTLLRRGDPRYRDLLEKAAKLASSTGQWPEAVHPLTGGGCMGDGQHGWAAAEWIQMIRNLFVREEEGTLILGSGLFPEWIASSEDLLFGPTPTPCGEVSLHVLKRKSGVAVQAQGRWRNRPPAMEIRMPGYRTEVIHDAGKPIEMRKAMPEKRGDDHA